LKGNALAHLALFTVQLLYGANYVIAKEVTPAYIKPFGLILIRTSIVVALFWLIASFFKHTKIDKADFPRLILCGLTGVTINQLMFMKGLSMTAPINASIIILCIPIFVLLFSALIIGEKLTLKKGIGIGLGALGALLIVSGSSVSQNVTASYWGDIFLIINCISYSFYLIIVKKLMKKYQPLQIIKWVFLFGFIGIIPFGWPEAKVVDWQNMPSQIYAFTAYVVIAATFLTYLFNIYSLKRVNASVVGAYIYIQPIIASTIAIALGKDGFTFSKLIAGLLICIGVYLVSEFRYGKKSAPIT